MPFWQVSLRYGESVDDRSTLFAPVECTHQWALPMAQYGEHPGSAWRRSAEIIVARSPQPADVLATTWTYESEPGSSVPTVREPHQLAADPALHRAGSKRRPHVSRHGISAALFGRAPSGTVMSRA